MQGFSVEFQFKPADLGLRARRFSMYQERGRQLREDGQWRSHLVRPIAIVNVIIVVQRVAVASSSRTIFRT
jgi:hypothetical protein